MMKQQNAKALQELFQTYLENLSYAREPMGLSLCCTTT